MTRITSSWRQKSVPVFVATLSLVVLTGPSISQAQTTTITSSGLNTTVGTPTTLPNGMINHDITGGTRPGNGPNLFHSFGEFSVGTNNIANFLNETALPTSNILSRVTGGNPSNIFGTLQTTSFGAANLYLINPAGVIFGPNASLNVGGSVNISTADYLRLADGAQFNALPGPADALLSMAPLKAFGFLGENPLAASTQPGSVEIRGGTVANGSALTVVGRDLPGPGGSSKPGITATGGMLANPGGVVRLASVGNVGSNPAAGAEMAVSDLKQTAINGGSASFGEIRMSGGATINTTGANPDAQGDVFSGAIFIRAGKLVMGTTTSAASLVTEPDGFFSVGGAITINVGTLETVGNSTISAGNFLKFGTPGRVTIQGVDSTVATPSDAAKVKLTDSTVTSSSQFSGCCTSSQVRPGDIVVHAREMILSGSQVKTFSFEGSTANILLDVSTLISTQTTSKSEISTGTGAGPAGFIKIGRVGGNRIDLTDTNVESLTINGVVGPINLYGEISLTASTVTLTRSLVSTRNINNGTASSLFINTDVLTLRDNSSLLATARIRGDGGSIVVRGASGNSTSAPTTIRIMDSTIEATSANGTAGNITIPASTSLSLLNSRISTTVVESGVGGTVIVKAPMITMSGGAITSETQGSGAAGNLSVNANTFTAQNNAELSTSSTGRLQDLGNHEVVFVPAIGPAGSITIQGLRVGNSVRSVSLDNSTISTTIAGGTSSTTPATTGITAQTVNLTNGAQIKADTSGAAPGGDTNVKASTLSMSPDSTITSSALAGSTGRAGTITLNNTGSSGMTVTGGTILGQSVTSSAAGNIAVRSTGDLNLLGTTVSVKNTGPGSAGSINLRARNNLLVRNSQVSTESAQASGGNIKLTAPNLIRIVNSTITSSAQGQAGSNGGNINIDPQLVVIQNSQLLANANAGAGGNITIAASGAVLIDPNSLLSASAEPAGVSGSVKINAPIQVLRGTLVPLKLAYSQAGLSGDRCAADPTGRFSSFVQTGRNGVPQVTGALSPSPLSFLAILTSGSLGLQSPSLAAARLGLDFVSVDDSTLFRFHSACRS